MPREPHPATPRKQMTPKRRIAVLTRYNGHCAYPECNVSEGLEIDHAICLELGGKEHDSNLVALCHAHHLQKTRLDMRLIAKMRRRQKKDVFQPREPSRLKGRKLSDSLLRRKFDGSVEARK